MKYMLKKRKRRYVLILLFSVILILEAVTFPKNVKAATYTQTIKEGIDNFPESYKSKLNELKELYPNWKFTAYFTEISWNEFIKEETSKHLRNTVIKTSNSLWKDSCGKEASGYACASEPIIKYFADPRNFLNESGIFQFLEMTYNENSQTEEGVKSIISSTFMKEDVTFNLDGKQQTMSYSKIIMDAAKESKMSPYSIAIKIIQEVGSKGSSSVSGNYVASDGTDYSGYYNFFNYGAYDQGDAIANGLAYAKDKGWNNQYTAIVEGAKKMADSYTNAGQNTSYFYKWDVVGNEKSDLFWHQYMTNIQDPSSQAKSLFNTYAKNNLLSQSLNFIIPIYNNMPNANTLPTTIDTSLESSYYLTGSDVRVRENASTSASIIATLNKNEVVTVLEWKVCEANGYDWAKIRLANGNEGYIANKYLAPCNDKNNENNDNNGGNSDNQQEKVSAKIEEKNIKTIPNSTSEEVAKALNIQDYEVTKGEAKIGEKDNIGTGCTFKDKKNNITYEVIMMGDANGDGRVTPGDSTMLLRSYVGLNQMTEIETKAVDINKDGKVTPADSTSILRAYVGLENIDL